MQHVFKVHNYYVVKHMVAQCFGSGLLLCVGGRFSWKIFDDAEEILWCTAAVVPLVLVKQCTPATLPITLKMTYTYDTSACVACCHPAFSAKVSFSWCILISRLLLSVVLHSHLLNSFLSLGKHKFYFHIIFIIIKTHLFSSSQKQSLRGILRSQGLQKLRRLFSICLKEYIFLSILLVLPASFSASVFLGTHSYLFCFGINLYFTEAPNSWLASDPAV